MRFPHVYVCVASFLVKRGVAACSAKQAALSGVPSKGKRTKTNTQLPRAFPPLLRDVPEAPGRCPFQIPVQFPLSLALAPLPAPLPGWLWFGLDRMRDKVACSPGLEIIALLGPSSEGGGRRRSQSATSWPTLRVWRSSRCLARQAKAAGADAAKTRRTRHTRPPLPQTRQHRRHPGRASLRSAWPATRPPSSRRVHGVERAGAPWDWPLSSGLLSARQVTRYGDSRRPCSAGGFRGASIPRRLRFAQ